LSKDRKSKGWYRSASATDGASEFCPGEGLRRDCGKTVLAAPLTNLAYLDTSPAAYQAYFREESNEGEDTCTGLIELERLFDQTPAAEVPAKLKGLVDIDSFLTVLALDSMTVNTDSYAGMAQNYYLYRRRPDKKWVWIPWDPSVAFGSPGQ